MYEVQHLDHNHKVTKNTIQATQYSARNTLSTKKNTVLFSIVVGAMLTCGSSVYAEATTNIETANTASEVMLSTVKVEGDREENPVYSGSGGQVTETNHAGFLGNKDALETPFSAISYTDKFINDQQATDVIDVIAATDPAIHTSNVVGENLESYSIRGFSSNSNDVTFNGLSGMAPYYRSATEMFERIEVLKGPSAMLNGMAPNGSIGGSVNLVTKRADNESLTRLTTKYISDSQIGTSIDIGRRFGEDKAFGVRINGAYSEGDTTINRQEKESELGSVALDWRGDRIRLSADLYRTSEHADAPIRGITIASGVDIPSAPDSDTILNPSWAFFDTETEGVITRGEFDVNTQLTIYAALGANEMSYEGLSASKAEVTNSDGDIDTTLGYVDDTNERMSMEIGLNGDFKTGQVNHQVASNITHYNETYNLNGLRFTDVYSTNIYNPVWGDQPDLDLNAPLLLTTETNLTSVGVADTLSFSEDKYQLTLGARYQEVKTEQTGGLLSTGAKYDESAVTPSLAFVIKMTDQVSLYANYIEGLSEGDTVTDTSASNYGEIFAPYKTKQKEIGVKFDGGEFSHTVSLYEIKKPNAYKDNDTDVYDYYGEQRNRGIEWSFFGTPVNHLRLMGGVSHIDAKITSASDESTVGNQASKTPKWQAKLGLEWDTPQIQNLTLTANTTAVSKQYLKSDNKQSLPSYTVYALGARYVTAIKQAPLTIRANIENLLDKNYWSTSHYNVLALGQGRTFTLSASMDF